MNSNCTCPVHCPVAVHPDQIKIDFGYSATSKAYERGYNTGYTWDANWMPGGPWVFRTSKKDNPKFVKMAADSAREHEEWHEGFKAGLAARLVENRQFARWWAENKGKKYDSKVNIHDIRYLCMRSSELPYQYRDDEYWRQYSLQKKAA